MDHFCNNIIRNELRALTTCPLPDPCVWAFSPQNNRLFAIDQMCPDMIPIASKGAGAQETETETVGTNAIGIAPMTWVNRGPKKMREALRI